MNFGDELRFSWLATKECVLDLFQFVRALISSALPGILTPPAYILPLALAFARSLISVLVIVLPLIIISKVFGNKRLAQQNAKSNNIFTRLLNKISSGSVVEHLLSIVYLTVLRIPLLIVNLDQPKYELTENGRKFLQFAAENLNGSVSGFVPDQANELNGYQIFLPLLYYICLSLFIVVYFSNSNNKQETSNVPKQLQKYLTVQCDQCGQMHHSKTKTKSGCVPNHIARVKYLQTEIGSENVSVFYLFTIAQLIYGGVGGQVYFSMKFNIEEHLDFYFSGILQKIFSILNINYNNLQAIVYALCNALLMFPTVWFIIDHISEFIIKPTVTQHQYLSALKERAKQGCPDGKFVQRGEQVVYCTKDFTNEEWTDVSAEQVLKDFEVLGAPSAKTIQYKIIQTVLGLKWSLWKQQ
ncbi:Conserved_hypothetical protein [Hexamita inflata]|uniref:Uncharacterized protein n=1 Tax=Hexamita inflata TaxID=28002 RepID=A0AA86P9X8_9EUKA|nr:Conserved hypothetical protein [Hexamita inflata]CAI9934553.1 Conserved hypothetical protein [Hexamita inflata]